MPSRLDPPLRRPAMRLRTDSRSVLLFDQCVEELSARVPDTPNREAWVVVPAKDEAERLGAAIAALSTAAMHARGSVHLVVVDDGSTDGTAEIAEACVAAWRWGDAVVLPGPAAGAGWARRVGLDHALAASGRRSDDDDALIATTDADSRVPPQWFAELHRLLDAGHDVVAGDVQLERHADPALVQARAERLAHRLLDLHRHDPSAEHPHFAGANLGWISAALRRLTPLPTPHALEDDALHRASLADGQRIARATGFAVVTSSRTDGRASVGLAAALRADAVRLGIDTAVA